MSTAMTTFTLYIGNKAYSSWSLRGWLACRLAGIAFEEVVVPLYQPDTRSRVLAVSPSGRMPSLHHGDRVIWDSLAIGEYLAELAPDKGLWPADAAARAFARSITAEMHSGFLPLRQSMPMNTRRRHPGRGHTPEALADAARIVAMWTAARTGFGAAGPFLFGRPTLADAAFAPVVSRFVTYAPPVTEVARAYMDAVMDWAPMRDWCAAAEHEAWVNPIYE